MRRLLPRAGPWTCPTLPEWHCGCPLPRSPLLCLAGTCLSPAPHCCSRVTQSHLGLSCSHLCCWSQEGVGGESCLWVPASVLGGFLGARKPLPLSKGRRISSAVAEWLLCASVDWSCPAGSCVHTSLPSQNWECNFRGWFANVVRLPTCQSVTHSDQLGVADSGAGLVGNCPGRDSRGCLCYMY